MSEKIVLSDVASGYNRQKINDNFQKIEQELNDKVLYRDNPDGEPNQMENDLDMNSHNVNNVNVLSAATIMLNGQNLADLLNNQIPDPGPDPDPDPTPEPSILIVQVTDETQLRTGPEPGEGTIITVDTIMGTGVLLEPVSQASAVAAIIEDLKLGVEIPDGFTYTALSLLAPASYSGGYTLALLDTAFDEYIDAGTPAAGNYSGSFSVNNRTGVRTQDVTEDSPTMLSFNNNSTFGGGAVYRIYVHEDGEDVRTGEHVQFWITDPDYL